ncbi:MAG TPA: tetratricopeptide repeat protein [Pirellulales bacterium]|nr:tetratricopeptide repeat protein [Pirellulales bacterium]
MKPLPARGPLFVFSLALLAAWGAALAADKLAERPQVEPAEPQVPPKIRSLLADRKYGEAAAAIDQAAGEEDADQEWLAYLKARALYLAGNYDEAVTAYKTAEQKFAGSRWQRRYRFGRALALARKGDFQAAEQIYRVEAEYLLSADRKQELAGIYLEFADRYFKPADEQEKPDFTKALEFYNKALEVGPHPDKREEVELRVARCYQELGNHAEAAQRYAQFTKSHPDSPLDLEARYRLGEVQLALNQREEARRTWQDLLATYAGNKSERVAEATFNLSQTYGLPAPSSTEDLDLGVAALEVFLERYPEHKLAGQAYLRIANAYVHCGRYEDAVKTLKAFLADDRYAGREESADARVLLGRSYQLQKKFDEALATWREFLAKHPSHSSWSDVQRSIIDTEFLAGAEAANAKHYDQARQLWQEFLVKYPLDPRAPRILLEFGRMKFLEDDFDAALVEWRRVVSKYPNTEESSQAQYLVALTLEEKLGNLADALKEYQKVTWGSYAAKAQQRIGRLTAKEMTVATERVFRSNETPKIRLTSRNVESVTVRAYTVDLETYFRKMHLASGVEGLDIALIDPDKTFEFAIPKYAEHQQFSSEIEIPIDEAAAIEGRPAGVMAVTVSSKTLEATTLVIQSDLDMIIKSSRDELFVFAQNLRTGKPWPKARLLISNGQQVFAESETGDDGVFQKSYEELKSAGDVRVFAVADGSVASNAVGLAGVGVSTGLTARGYIYSDRPAYRAGQVVHIRGIVRNVDHDRFTIDEGKKFRLEVYDGRSRLIRQEEVALGKFGSFHDHFVLPDTSVAGDYRVQIQDDDGEGYQGGFRVHEYQLEPVRLAVDTERKVFYRGEEITGKITAKFYYGAPLADREIRYQLAGGRVYTGTTDEQGELEFKLPTREFRESQALPLVVTLAERNLQTSVNFYLATQGFSIGLNTVRKVFVAGETFEVSLNTRDAEGKPIGEKLMLHVLKRTVVDGKVGESQAEEHELTTDKEGKARVTLRLEEGGQYVLRAEGTDRFKNRVSGTSAVQISDDNDRVRLRILADRHTYKVGDKATVQLHWREAPALALITFQGGKILDYRLTQLKKGANEFVIPMTTLLAPNFDLAVSVMTDTRAEQKDDPEDPEKADQPSRVVRRFHEASSPFTVERELRVTIETKPKGGDAARPGDDVEVTIAATDPQGKPVEAELSLAMIEQALWEVFGSNVSPIVDFFRGQPRASAVRTQSSVTFAYHPATRPINAQLLAEKDRREVEEMEQSARQHLQLAISQTQERQEAAERKREASKDAMLGSLRVLAGAADRAPAGQPSIEDEVTDLEMAGEFREVGGRPMSQGGQVPVGQGWALSEGEALEGFGSWYDLGRDADYDGRAGDNYVQLDRPAGSAPVEFTPNDMSAASGLRGAMGGAVARPGADKLSRRQTGKHLFGMSDSGDRDLSYRRVAGPTDAKAALSDNFAYFAQPDASALLSLNASGQSNSTVLFSDGTQNNIKFSEHFGEEDAKKLAARLGEAGAIVLPPQGSQETAYWNPIVVTDKDGKATVSITLPERTTAWKLLAKGITADTLAGEAEAELVVKKDLFGELKLPLAFTDGDQAEIQTTIHNDLEAKEKIEVTLKTTIGGKSVEEKKTIEAGKGMQDVPFKVEVKLPADKADGKPAEKKEADDKADRPHADSLPKGEGMAVEVELTVVAGERRDVVQRTVPIRPYGMPVFAGASGSATSDTTAFVEAPAGMTLVSPTLEVIIGPNMEQSLIDALLAPAPLCQVDVLRLASGLETSTSDLMAAVGLQRLLGATRQAGTPQAAALDARVRSSLSLLVSSQNDDGGWSWAGRATASNRYTSARAVWALSLARAAGYKVTDEVFEKGIGYLQGQVATTAETDYDSKSVLLAALASAGRGDFTLANRLYRNRPALSTGALVYLALALAEMDRQPMAHDLFELLGKRKLDGTPEERSARALLAWNDASAELHALYLLALEKAEPESTQNKEQVDWLLAHRSGYRWAPDKATGPAVLALSRWFAKTRFDSEHYQLTLVVNGFEAAKVDVTPETKTQTIKIPTGLLKGDKQRIQFQLAGRGQYAYQCLLSGFVPADKLQSTTKNWLVRRYYEPAPREFDGEAIPRGFDVVQGAFTTFRNPLTQLPVGQRGHVEIHVSRANLRGDTPDEKVEYLVVTEPLPAGVTVIEQSVTGSFERFELAPGQITFFVGSQKYPGAIGFDVHGYLPGAYRAGPTAVRNAYRPEQLAVADSRQLAVLRLGERSQDEYRLSPRELFEFGKRHFAKHEWQAAATHLNELVSKWQLQPQFYQEAARMLLDVHLELGVDAEIVRWFELIKEKWPDVELPFEKILRVAAAYDKIGEYERSFLVFRATIEGSFLRESNVAGFLDTQGEFLRSVAVMGRLLAEYPPEPYAAAAQYALAQRVYAYAPQAVSDAKLREKKITRVDLVEHTLTMLDGFLTAYPEDPAADQASFSLANALLELKLYRQAVERCRRFADRYPASDYLDSFWYIVGYSHFALGEHEEALAMCRKVAEAKHVDRQTGREEESRNKWQAIYILAQIYNSLGKAAEAIQEYTRVEERFADARRAIEYFTRKAIELPEVSTFEPDEKVEVELKFRNVARCDARVYKIDLMKFSLLKRNLSHITGINLAGIRPYHEAAIELGDGKDYRDRTRKLPLPLKEEGAYLVVCRGDDLHASGLVLVSPLKVEVQEEASSGEVRTTVKDVTKDRYVNEVHVKVIGSRNAEFISGDTDLRGVFVADGVQGTTTVIAEEGDNRYAFFRGHTELGPQPPAANAPAAMPQPAEAKPAADESQQLLRQLFESNGAIQQLQNDNLKNIYQQNKQGVQLKEAF